MNREKIKKYLPIAGAIAIGLLVYFIQGGILPPLIGFALGYVGFKVAVTPRGATSSAGELVADGIAKIDFDAAIREARSRYNALQNDAFRITKVDARRKVDAIVSLVGQIIDQVKKDPKDYRAARQFFSYYLEATVKVVHFYVELTARPVLDAEAKTSIENVENELDTVRRAFEKQLKVLDENDVLDLDTELTVLKRTIELEGLSSALDQPEADSQQTK